MRLISRMEGNVREVGQYKEHLTQLWDILGPLSRASVKVARLKAKKEHPDG